VYLLHHPSYLPRLLADVAAKAQQLLTANPPNDPRTIWEAIKIHLFSAGLTLHRAHVRAWMHQFSQDVAVEAEARVACEQEPQCPQRRTAMREAAAHLQAQVRAAAARREEGATGLWRKHGETTTRWFFIFFIFFSSG
jgi:hypothetical protein